MGEADRGCCSVKCHSEVWVTGEAVGVERDPSAFSVCPSSLLLGRYFRELHRGLHSTEHLYIEQKFSNFWFKGSFTFLKIENFKELLSTWLALLILTILDIKIEKLKNKFLLII